MYFRRFLDSFYSMNYLFKRIFVGVCIALVMMVVHKVSHAAPMSTMWRYTSGSIGNSDYIYSSSASACSALISGWSSGSSAYTDVSVDTACKAKRNSDGQVFSVGGASSRSACSDGTVPSSGVCPDPVPVNKCVAGKSTTFTYMVSATGRVPVDDQIGCPINPNAQRDQCFKDGSVTFCTLTGTQTGAPAVAGDGSVTDAVASKPGDVPSSNPQVPADPQLGCPPGTSNYGIDSAGTTMCAGTGVSPVVATKTVTSAAPVTTSNADGSTTTTNSNSSINADGSTTTTKTDCTVGADGNSSCSTNSKTGSNTAGGAGKPDNASGAASSSGSGAAKSKDDPKDLCALHPELNVCQNSQVVGVGCNGSSSNVGYTGDAIQGAILKKIADEDCARSAATPQSKLYDLMASGSDPLAATLPSTTNGTTVNGSSSLDSSGFLGGGACFPDKSFPIGGRTVVIPFSNVCPYLVWFRAAVMLLALMSSFAILQGAILRE